MTWEGQSGERCSCQRPSLMQSDDGGDRRPRLKGRGFLPDQRIQPCHGAAHHVIPDFASIACDSNCTVSVLPEHGPISRVRRFRGCRPRDGLPGVSPLACWASSRFSSGSTCVTPFSMTSVQSWAAQAAAWSAPGSSRPRVSSHGSSRAPAQPPRTPQRRISARSPRLSTNPLRIASRRVKAKARSLAGRC